ncbi:MAG: hypothetical protein HWQ58_17960 [Nostoc sp. LPT]|nr:hypothetical protein [Nostoc sp. LPT]
MQHILELTDGEVAEMFTVTRFFEASASKLITFRSQPMLRTNEKISISR